MKLLVSIMVSMFPLTKKSWTMNLNFELQLILMILFLLALTVNEVIVIVVDRFQAV